MATALNSLLAPSVINEAVAELEVDNTQLQQLFRTDSLKRDIPGRNFAWDVFNPSREVATARLPGTPPAKTSLIPVDNVQGRFPRVHEEIPLLYEEIHNQRKIGGQANELDLLGRDFISEQEQRLKQKVTNHIEFQIAAMMRGTYTYTITGDDLIPGFSGGQVTIDYRIPANNKNQLNGIIGTTWINAAAPIPDNLYAIDKQMTALTGKRLKHVVCNSTLWSSIQKNTACQALAGTANVIFDYINQGTQNPDNFTAVLRGIPWVQWHIVNEVLNLDSPPANTPSTATLMIADTQACFLPEIKPDWFQYWNGSEVVVEWEGMPPHEEYGTYYWAYATARPAGYSLVTLHNGIPALKNPNAIFAGTVVF